MFVWMPVDTSALFTFRDFRERTQKGCRFPHSPSSLLSRSLLFCKPTHRAVTFSSDPQPRATVADPNEDKNDRSWRILSRALQNRKTPSDNDFIAQVIKAIDDPTFCIDQKKHKVKKLQKTTGATPNESSSSKKRGRKTKNTLPLTSGAPHDDSTFQDMAKVTNESKSEKIKLTSTTTGATPDTLLCTSSNTHDGALTKKGGAKVTSKSTSNDSGNSSANSRSNGICHSNGSKCSKSTSTTKGYTTDTVLLTSDQIPLSLQQENQPSIDFDRPDDTELTISDLKQFLTEQELFDNYFVESCHVTEQARLQFNVIEGPKEEGMIISEDELSTHGIDPRVFLGIYQPADDELSHDIKETSSELEFAGEACSSEDIEEQETDEQKEARISTEHKAANFWNAQNDESGGREAPNSPEAQD